MVDIPQAVFFFVVGLIAGLKLGEVIVNIVVSMLMKDSNPEED